MSVAIYGECGDLNPLGVFKAILHQIFEKHKKTSLNIFFNLKLIILDILLIFFECYEVMILIIVRVL